jgi:hypothetical protein
MNTWLGTKTVSLYYGVKYIIVLRISCPKKEKPTVVTIVRLIASKASSSFTPAAVNIRLYILSFENHEPFFPTLVCFVICASMTDRRPGIIFGT